LLGNGVADALLGEVALYARVIRPVLQRRLLPAPGAIGGEIPCRIEIALHLRALAGDEGEE